MVKSQILPNAVHQTTIVRAFEKVPRENFVEQASVSLAYSDSIVPIAPDRYLLSPVSFSKLIQATTILSTHKVLVVGFGTGYSLAILSFLSKYVTGLESSKTFCATALKQLELMHANHVKVVQGPLHVGWQKPSPYDVIIIEGALWTPPYQLLEQLSPQGKLATFIKSPNTNLTRAVIFHKQGKNFVPETLFEAEAPLLKELCTDTMVFSL